MELELLQTLQTHPLKEQVVEVPLQMLMEVQVLQQVEQVVVEPGLQHVEVLGLELLILEVAVVVMVTHLVLLVEQVVVDL